MSSTITFEAEHIGVEPGNYNKFQVVLEADMKEVVADMDLEDRLHEIEPADIVETVGAVNLLNAISETHFDQWVKAHGDYYEALNAIGIEKIREWVDTYTSGE
jgi:hypothetical protein